MPKLITQFDQEGIERLIPHRGVMLLVNSAIVYGATAEEAVIETSYLVHSDSLLMDGHFPDPIGKIFPGFMIAEAMAQAGAVLFVHLNPEFAGRPPILAGADKFRCRKPVLPGDRLCASAKVVKMTIGKQRAMVVFETTAKVRREIGDDELEEIEVASAEITGVSML